MYAASADAVNSSYPNSLHVLSHLLGMSIELALKAFLRKKGYKENELRKLGHNLRKIYTETTNCGLTDTGSREFRLAVLGALYQGRIFAYPQQGVMNTIEPWSLRQIADEIICEVFAAIKGKKALTRMKHEPGLYIGSVYPEDVHASAWAQQSPLRQKRRVIVEDSVPLSPKAKGAAKGGKARKVGGRS